jgi:hypothetical protein
MDKRKLASAGTARDGSEGRLEELIDALLASVRGGGEVPDPNLPGPVSCAHNGQCVHSPCATPPVIGPVVELPTPLCAVLDQR